MWSNRPLYFNLSSQQRFIVATWRKRSGTLTSSNGSGHELRYPDEDPKLAPAEGRASSAGPSMPKPNRVQREEVVNVMERRDEASVNILPRPFKREVGVANPEFAATGKFDGRDKGKWRTLEEYFKDNSENTKLLMGGKAGTSGTSHVLVAATSLNQGSGRMMTLQEGNSLKLHMMTASWSNSGDSTTTHVRSVEGEEYDEAPALVSRSHVRFTSRADDTEKGSDPESSDSMEDRQKYARDNERELLYKRRMQQAEYAKECLERKVAQMTNRVRATEKLVLKTTQKLREAEREKEVI